jgi:hypothetical protein
VPEPVFTRWSKLLAAGFALIVLGLPLALFVLSAGGFWRRGDHQAPTSSRHWSPAEPVLPAPSPHHPVQPAWRDALPAGTGDWPIAIAVVAALAVAVSVWMLLAHRRTRGPASSPTPAGDTGPRRLAAGAAAGGRALLSVDDPRAAVVACYTAMEDVLAEAGAGPRGSDTPSEVLARASGAGLAGLGAAETLTGLFYEARYSVHPVTEEHRARARRALQELRTWDRP